MNYNLNSIGSILIMIGAIGYLHYRRRRILIKNKTPFNPDENIFEAMGPKPKPESTPRIFKKWQLVFGAETKNSEIKETRFIEESPRTIGLIELKMKVFILTALMGFILLAIDAISWY